MSPWIPTFLSVLNDNVGAGKVQPPRATFAYGGHVYAQAGMAASRTFAETRATSANGKSKKQFGIHVRPFKPVFSQSLSPSAYSIELDTGGIMVE